MSSFSETVTPALSDGLTNASSLASINGGPGRIDFGQLAELALANFATVVEEILGLEGEYRGQEFVAINPKRDDHELGSFSINVESGKYADFAILDECKGGDLIALASYIWDCRPIEAAKQLQEKLRPQADVPTALDLIRSANRMGRERFGSSVASQVMEPIPDGSPELDVRRFESHGSTVEERYDYLNTDGKRCFVQLRLRRADGGKTFMTLRVDRHEDGSLHWTGGMPEGQRPLFGLNALAGACDDQLVFVVEGEKAALALQKMLPSVVVVTSAGGASAPSKTDWSPLAGRNVVIWRDNDGPGLNYQDRVVQLIRAIDLSTRISVIDVESLLRTFCPMMGWVYDEKAVELKGWDAADVAALGLDHSVIAEVVAAATREVSVDGVATASEALIEPEGPHVSWATDTMYLVRDGRVLASKAGRDGQPYSVPVCSRVDIVRQLRDDVSTGWSLELVLHTPDGRTKTHILPRSRLSDLRTLKAEMNDLGVIVYNWAEFQQYLEHAIPRDTHRLVRNVGWHDGVFVQADRVYGAASESLALDSDAPASKAFWQHGELARWNRDVGRLCASNSRLMLSVCTSLAGPLLGLLGVENGGIHLVGPSSVGKTTSLRVAASVWGEPTRIIQSWRSTSNGLEVVAAGLNDSVLLLDELNQASPQEAGEAVYMLGNGQGKQRMGRSGHAARLLQWRLLFMSTGEIPLQQHIESAGRMARAGMEVRLLNVPADAGHGFGLFDSLAGFESSKELADHLHTSTLQVFGVAGHTWLSYLVGQMAEQGYAVFCEGLQTRLGGIENLFVRSNADGLVNRAARRFAILALAGEMAERAGIGGWAADESIVMLQHCFEAWIVERGGTGSSEEAQALRQVQRFFEQHGQSAFQRVGWPDGLEGAEQSRVISNRAGYYGSTKTGGMFFVLPEPFKSRVCEGLNVKLVVDALRKHGLLLRDASNTARVPDLPNAIRAYWISERIIGFGPGEPQAEQDLAIA
ncbi:DUF927 domain-containing protein [Paraburkholderia aromaticivorans]|uniref:DUF927 domain-containing protein n=1 Tax=Paraburkholderia aromaticivorans TaxID=2026199 RepID=A0A248VIY6_9BURK|nr:DUF927 domain-containing protein [Paraburkholderia aromaticivorans]ASV98993.1 hypothetical protein CJU94_13005 [Paraburkholderia aromaticivorans]